MNYLPEHLINIAENFQLSGDISNVREYGSGKINDTFLVTLKSGVRKKVILQRINEKVFHHPEWMISNMRVITDHINERLKNDQLDGSGRRWEVPHIISARDGKDFFIDSHGSFWRAMSFIDASTVTEVRDAEYAREFGYGLGRFHSLVSDIETDKLFDTLAGFHITPENLRSFDEAVKSTEIKEQSSRARYCLNFISERRKMAFVLEEAKDEKKLFSRPIHGDPKFDNIMIDRDTGKAVGIIDLDTVKPGLVHYDIGDCLRSCCNPLGEEPEKIKDVHFRTDFCKAVLEGYLTGAHHFLSENDYFYLYDAIRLIPFELGLRFFTDYLKGNVYFKVNREEDNLFRALVQFRLTESIESQESDIRSIIDELKRNVNC